MKISLKISQFVLKPINKLSLKIIVLPIFGQYVKLSTKINRRSNNLFDRIILVFTNKFLIHLLIFVIVFGVAVSNILAYESQENYGRNAVIYDIVGTDTFDTIESTSAINAEATIYRYTDVSGQLTSDIYTESQRNADDILSQQNQGDLAITQGGVALTKPGLASTEAAKITRTSVREYQVAEGDTISTIASNFDISVNTILWANNLSYYSFIRPGQNLIIPPQSGVLHKITSGDTLSGIASKYRANINSIKSFNNIENDSALTIGEMLMVPGGQIVATPRPRAVTPTPVVSIPAFTPPVVINDGTMYWPSECRRISQYYLGWRHTGLDIACGWGKPIRAAEAGTVLKIAYLKSGYGYHVIIDHGGGKQTLYAHLSRILVETGQKVDKASIIGLEGSTGRSTGAHLHFEVRINGERLNPLNYVK